MSRPFVAGVLLAALSLSTFALAEDIKPLYGVAMHGQVKYAAGFQHLDYVNPEAPKGGEIHLATAGTFDSLNPYIIKGVAAPGIGMVYQTLMANTEDEALSEYGLIAKTIEMPEDRSWVVFNLNPDARWNDGQPITADDVVWSFDTLMSKGHPHYRAYYANVKSAVAETPTRVRFTFNMAGNRELPIIVGQLPVLPTWHAEYDQPPVRQGLIKKEEIHHSLPAGMQAFAFNLRRALFQDVRVRQALGHAFDFEWSNKQFAYSSYKRTQSYFANSELASAGMPSGRELEILKKYKGQIPDEALNKEFSLPKTSGSGQDMRQNLTIARKLLAEAGWQMGKSGGLEKDGQPFKFEILIDTEAFERWINPMIANLKKLGIEAKLRYVDTAQYQNRMNNFDFDMTVTTFGESLSPGNEQRDFWSSAKADVKGSRNLIGIKNPVVDQLIDLLISAPDRDELVARTHALDRVLLWNYYVIPQWHLDYFRVAYWDKFGKPAISPKYGLGIVDTWWYDAEKAAKIASKINTP
ncbi:MAG: ABC transporter substrate-binding protein [Proteobacteria bacterium]|nr:ABC transporter substrate-binding protein [Pseudomonadota bacterium]